MVLNDERVEPLAASQFQPPSGSCSREQPVDDAPHILAEIGADRRDLPVDTGLQLALKEGTGRHIPAGRIPSTSPGRGQGPVRGVPASLAGSRPMSRSSIRTCIVEFQPRFHAAPPHRPSAALEGEQLRARALGRDPCALGR